MNVLAVHDIQQGWERQIVPFLQSSADKVAQSVGYSFSHIFSSVSDLLTSVDHSSHLFRLVSNVSSLAKSLFGVPEPQQVQKLSATADVLQVTRCFTFPHYIFGGHFEEDCRQHRFWSVGSACLWAVADLSATCMFFFPSLSTKKISILNVREMTLVAVGTVSDALASCCDLAGRVHKVWMEKNISPSEFFNLMGSGSDVLSSFLILFHIRAKVALVALYAFSNMASLLSRVLSNN